MLKLLNVSLDGELTITEGDELRLKIAFATCVQLGLSCIQEIFSIGGNLELLITLKDEKAKKKSGRVYLDEIAAENKVPLIKIDNINDQVVVDRLKSDQIDWLFIIGWSQIAKKPLLDAPKLGCIGMHPTLLPVGRGRAAIPWAIIKGLKKTGVTLFKLDEGVDTGDIIGQEVILLNEKTTATELYQQVNDMHVSLISKYWDKIVNNQITLQKQDETKASEWPGRKPEDGQILNSMTMDEADRLVRAVTTPYPGAFYREGTRTIRIWSASINRNSGQIKLADGYLTPVNFEIEG